MAETANEETFWLGVDLGGTKMLATVYDGSFRPVGSDRKRTKGHKGEQSGLKRMRECIEEALEKAGVAPGQVCGIGVGCPGPLDLQRGVILEAPNLGWNDVPVKQALENAFGIPAVIGNDVDMGVYGEYRFGAGRQARCVVGVFPGTGIGGGCVYEGKILRGRIRSCMEIGHIQLLAGGPRSGTGQSGSLEAIASRLAIAGQAAQAAYRGQAPHLRELAGTDLSQIRSGVLAAAIEAGDTVVEQIVRDAARNIGIAVAAVVNLLAPEVIVLGGGLVEAMPKLMVSEVSDASRQHVMPTFVDTFRVVPAELKDEATVKGAAAWAEAVVLGK